MMALHIPLDYREVADCMDHLELAAGEVLGAQQVGEDCGYRTFHCDCCGERRAEEERRGRLAANSPLQLPTI